MGEVNQLDFRIDIKDDSFHYADEVVCESKIRGQSDYGSRQDTSSPTSQKLANGLDLSRVQLQVSDSSARANSTPGKFAM